MASQPETFTYLLILNDSDLAGLDLINSKRPLYVHSYVDIVFMSLLILASFLTNAALVTAIVSHRVLRRIQFNVLLLGLAILNLLDSMFNGCMAIAYMTRIVWDLGYPLCSINAFAVQVSLIVMPFLLLYAGVDRALHVRHPVMYENHVTVGLYAVVVFVTWIVACFGALYLVIDEEVICPYPARMACGPSPGHSQYAYLLLVFGVTVPLLGLLGCTVFFLWFLFHDRRLKQTLQSRAWPQGPNSMHGTLSSKSALPLGHHEMRSFYSWLLLFVSFLVGPLPFALHSHLQQMTELSVDEDRWELCRTPNWDTFVSWLRFLATWGQPLIIFVLSGELCKQAMAIVCWSWNSHSPAIFSEDIGPGIPPQGSVVVPRGKSKKVLDGIGLKRHSKSRNCADPRTPILFITSAGLMLRKTADNSVENYECHFCDVYAECCAVAKQRDKVHLSESGKDLTTASGGSLRKQGRNSQRNSRGMSYQTRHQRELGVWS